MTPVDPHRSHAPPSPISPAQLTCLRPRGAWNIPRKGPILFIAAPHANQFLDPLVLFSEVRKESGRRVSMLTAAKVSYVRESS